MGHMIVWSSEWSLIHRQFEWSWQKYIQYNKKQRHEYQHTKRFDNTNINTCALSDQVKDNVNVSYSVPESGRNQTGSGTSWHAQKDATSYHQRYIIRYCNRKNHHAIDSMPIVLTLIWNYAHKSSTEIILRVGLANERRRYFVTSSFIGCAHSQDWSLI